MDVALTRHGYLIDGVAYPRVSSVLSVIAKPGLDAWRKKVGFEAAERIVQEASAFGTLVHRACERVAVGESAADVIRALEVMGDAAAARCVGGFARWLAEQAVGVLGVERVVRSERLGYAGTADLLVTLADGRRAVVDIKTSRSLSESYRVQLEAYRLALEEEGEPFEARLVVWLPSSCPGVLVTREYADHEADRRAWRAALALYRWNAACRDDWKADRALLDAMAAAPT